MSFRRTPGNQSGTPRGLAYLYPAESIEDRGVEELCVVPGLCGCSVSQAPGYYLHGEVVFVQQHPGVEVPRLMERQVRLYPGEVLDFPEIGVALLVAD